MRALCVTLLAASMMFGQSFTTLGLATSGGSGTITPSCTGCLVTSSGQLFWTGSSSAWPTESRKDDGKGPTIRMIRASAHKLAGNEVASASYISLAKSLGVSTPLDEAQLVDAIHQADLTVYNFDQVDNYLYRQASRMKSPTRWVWRPLRDSDKEVADKNFHGMNQTDSMGWYDSDLYAKRVPMKALGDMRAILDLIPNAVFMVSDFKAINPDPFLAVSTPRLLNAGKVWIIEQWDEPGFGEPESGNLTMAAK